MTAIELVLHDPWYADHDEVLVGFRWRGIPIHPWASQRAPCDDDVRQGGSRSWTEGRPPSAAPRVEPLATTSYHAGMERGFVGLNVSVLAVGEVASFRDDPSAEVVVQRFGEAGHRILKTNALPDDRDHIGAAIEAAVSDAEIDVLLIIAGITAEHCVPALEPHATRWLDGFRDLFRHLTFNEVGSSAMLVDAEAALCTSTLVFVVPSSVGAVRTALDRLLLPQLDYRTSPRNAVMLLPRIGHVHDPADREKVEAPAPWISAKRPASNTAPMPVGRRTGPNEVPAEAVAVAAAAAPRSKSTTDRTPAEVKPPAAAVVSSSPNDGGDPEIPSADPAGIAPPPRLTVIEAPQSDAAIGRPEGSSPGIDAVPMLSDPAIVIPDIGDDTVTDSPQVVAAAAGLAPAAPEDRPSSRPMTTPPPIPERASRPATMPPPLPRASTANLATAGAGVAIPTPASGVPVATDDTPSASFRVESVLETPRPRPRNRDRTEPPDTLVRSRPLHDEARGALAIPPQRSNATGYVVAGALAVAAVAAVLVVYLIVRGGNTDAAPQLAANTTADRAADPTLAPTVPVPDPSLPSSVPAGDPSPVNAAASPPPSAPSAPTPTANPVGVTPPTANPVGVRPPVPSTSTPPTATDASGSRRSSDRTSRSSSRSSSDATTPPPPPGVETPPSARDLEKAPKNATTDGCDEVSCMLDKFARPCCEKFKPAEPPPSENPAEPPKPSSGLPATLDKSMIQSSMSSVKPAVIVCGEAYPVKGTVSLRVDVAPSGAITGLTVRAAPDPGLGECVASAVRKASFPQTDNGGSFGYPFVF